jgi:hypothetical protein
MAEMERATEEVQVSCQRRKRNADLRIDLKRPSRELL